MKLKKFFFALFLALISVTSAVRAEVISFNDITYVNGDPAPVVANYAGFAWSNIWTARPTYPAPFFNGGLGNGTNVGFMISASATSSFASADAFTLNSVEFAKMFYSGLTRFDGYVGDTLTFSKDVYSTFGSSEVASFNWSGVTRVDISVFDGSDRISFDNIAINQNVSVSPIPEPASIALFGAGMVLVGAIRRRKKIADKV